jgi:hypothetical protein
MSHNTFRLSSVVNGNVVDCAFSAANQKSTAGKTKHDHHEAENLDDNNFPFGIISNQNVSLFDLFFIPPSPSTYPIALFETPSEFDFQFRNHD